jgi:hypothetical protein
LGALSTVPPAVPPMMRMEGFCRIQRRCRAGQPASRELI